MRSRPLTFFLRPHFRNHLGSGACYALFPDQLFGLFGTISNTNPLFYLAVYAPSFLAGGESRLRSAD
jgi:hypothetical protein